MITNTYFYFSVCAYAIGFDYSKRTDELTALDIRHFRCPQRNGKYGWRQRYSLKCHRFRASGEVLTARCPLREQSGQQMPCPISALVSSGNSDPPNSGNSG